ncbi:DUF309 domain-containing protein [Neosynechococcus sphagnicola]|nr:DUF309 domain-containing protein [Neosynechococcus sphagnicola]
MSTAFWAAIAQFNRGEFYDCHDTLEALWVESSDPLRRFYQGLLQIAVACYHLSNQNLRGAAILLGEGLQRLQSYPSDYGGIDLEQLLGDTAGLLAQIQAQLANSDSPPVAPNSQLQLPQITRVKPFSP